MKKAGVNARTCAEQGINDSFFKKKQCTRAAPLLMNFEQSKLNALIVFRPTILRVVFALAGSGGLSLISSAFAISAIDNKVQGKH